mgnify:CR=1 FL=1
MQGGMQQVTIGLFHDETIAKELGKKATASDMVFFHRKKDDLVFSFVYPVEDKITAKSQIMNMLDVAIISAEHITPAVGETILMLDSLKVTKGIFIIPPYADTHQLEKMIKDTSLESFQFISKDVHKIIYFLEKQAIKRNQDEAGVITIDHSFHVKGVGEVVLGFVTQGNISKHDKLMIQPIGKETLVRSIQMQDDDVDHAPTGSRVGLALKNVTVDDLKRGYLLSTSEEVHSDSSLTLSFSKNPFYPTISTGSFHATIGLQTVPIKITNIETEKITIETDKPVCYLKNQAVIILDLNADKLHHMGTGTIT